MRKGRSSRRSRISRPLVSVKGEALSTDAGPSSGHASPRVVISVPPSDPPPSMDDGLDALAPAQILVEKVETKGPATERSSVMNQTIVRGSMDREALPPPPSEPPVSEPVIPEAAETPKVDLRSTVLAGSSAVPKPVVVEEPEPAPVEKVDLTKTVVAGSTESPKFVAAPEPAPAPAPVEEKKPNFAKTLAFGSKINELPQSAPIEVAPARDRAVEKKERKESRERLKETRRAAEAAQRIVSPKEDPDEISVPPASELENDVESARFFSGAEESVRKSVHEFEMQAAKEQEDLVPEKARRKADPRVARRREKFAGYVKIATAAAAIVCLAAVGRSAMHGRADAPAPPAAAPQAIAAEKAPVMPKAAEPTAAAAPPAATPPVEEAKKEAAPAPAAEPAADATNAAAAEPAKEEITGDAKEELKKSRKALERGRAADAIAAGEKSVALDATDGEAWLILGAAYQEKGDLTNAQRCYRACLKEGKTGPRHECQKMLH